MARLIIFGAGGIAKLAHHYFTRDSEHKVVAFTVDQAYREGNSFLGLPLVDFEAVSHLYSPSSYSMFIAVSYAKMNTVRARKYYQAKELNYRLVSYVSSRSSFLTDSPVGDNCFILEDSIIQPFARIGNNVTVWSGSHIGHDSIIEDHCFIAPNVAVSGHVHIHSYCFIGLNSTLRNSITIAPETLIGAGAIIMESTTPKSVYVAQKTEVYNKKSDEIDL